ncbi:BCCT family transporter [Alkalilimnicola ehrlichii]|uniref:Choline transporter n=1 Tax=Alkalilimnicola ehrlichii TaxID=351052 RepID=A0A3E0WKZ4_9GAMM|nr:BCCT family transporter [Alkalilimnicola ehrlichii]RFA33079.1 choline transporter [Alkalilimnicola ehrlichii]
MSLAVILLFVVVGARFTEHTGRAFGVIQNILITYFGWFYVIAVTFFLIFVVILMFSRYGSIRLGGNDSEPDYSYGTWFAMLFSAGMGIGLLFFSVAEPISHFAEPPVEAGGTVAAAQNALRLTYFHWGLHAWGIYIIVGLSLAYFSFRRGLPLAIRSAFYPLLGPRIYGPIGNLIDILAVFGTMFGIATSLGLGVMQINAGLNYLFGLAESIPIQIALIAIITAIATLSVVLGLDRGIRRLSEFNLSLGLLLALLVLAIGPTMFIVDNVVQTTGFYLQRLLETTVWLNAFGDKEWQAEWTLFYWGWWIAWSPFVGMFIARISRGRTIREFILGVLLVPTLLTFAWMAIFGGTALHIELFGEGGLVQIVEDNLPLALFALLQDFPFAMLTSSIATIVVLTFFVTSSDSGSLVIDILASGGHAQSPTIQRLFWAVLEGVVAAILLLTGGLLALQTAAVTTALPFTVVLLFMCYSLHRSLRSEPLTPGRHPNLYGDEKWD